MAARALNFQFLGVHGPRVEEVGLQAERLAWIDAPACLGKIRVLGELLAAGAAMRLRVLVPDGDQAAQLRALERAGAFSHEVRVLFLVDRSALAAVLQRPRDLTREGLKAVRQALDDAGYTEPKLRVAWRMKTNEDIAATVVGFIRQRGLGDALVPYADRVDAALARVLASRPWTEEQRRWLERIARQMKSETVVDRAALDRGAFQTFGGAQRADKVFGGAVDEVLGDLHEAVWTRAG